MAYKQTLNQPAMSRVGSTKEENLKRYQSMFPQTNVLQSAKTVLQAPKTSATNTNKPMGGSSYNTSMKNNIDTSGDQKRLKEYQSQIDKLYKQGLENISGQERRLQEYQPQYLSQVQALYESQVPELQRITEQGRTAIGEQETGVRKQEQTALAEARRQYEQGVQKGQQLFGGVAGSSTGQAFSDIASQELLRGTGNVMTTSSENINRLNTARRDLESKLQTDLAKLDLDKKSALLTAQNQFRQELDSINSKRYELQTQKANAQLQALKDFNSRKQNLEDFYIKQQADLQNYQAKLSMQTAASASNLGSVVDNINLETITNPQSKLAAFDYLISNPEIASYSGYIIRNDPDTGEPVLVQAKPLSTGNFVRKADGSYETYPDMSPIPEMTPAGQIYRRNQF
jgi:hypothetical protein